MTFQFLHKDLDSQLAQPTLGEAFQVFVAEALKQDFPNIQPYPARGPDGGIDHSADEEKGLTVIECKQTEGDWTTARTNWRKTKTRLSQGLKSDPADISDRDKPWISQTQPIAKYIVCHSATFPGEASRQEWRDEIREFFAEVSKRGPHLSHLKDIEVEVWDWSRITLGLPTRLKLRWFPGSRPTNIWLISSRPSSRGFVEWLRSDNLPYYSRADHSQIAPYPKGLDLSEKSLLAGMDARPDVVCWTIDGPGGIGKSRLALELALLRQEEGWSVFSVGDGATLSELQSLSGSLEDDQKALFLFDYAERNASLGDFVQWLTHRDARGGGAQLCLATCRTSFKESLMGLEGLEFLDLEPETPLHRSWLVSHREAAVRHILRDAGLEDDVLPGAISHGPVLASFIHWRRKRHPDDAVGLDQEDVRLLLQENGFAKWILRRLGAPHSNPSVLKKASLLLCQFPLPKVSGESMNQAEKELLDYFTTDGWIFYDQIDGQWAVAHDVLCDQVVVSCLETLGASSRHWLSDAFAASIRLGTLSSLLRSLTRVKPADYWAERGSLSLVEQAIRGQSDTLTELREELLLTPFLPLSWRLNALTEEGAYFHPELREDRRITSLAYLAREAASFPGSLPAGFLGLLKDSLLDDTTGTLAALTVKINPAESFPAVKGWLSKHSEAWYASYVFQSWLFFGSDPSAIEIELSSWLQIWGLHKATSYVLATWLKQGGNPLHIRTAVLNWLQANGKTSEARFVLAAWLEKAGEPQAVRETVLNWLQAHGETPEARFVLAPWLDKAGEPQAVRETVLNWLQAHGETPEAQFVLAPWLDKAGEPQAVKETVLKWLQAHGESLEADFVLKRWLDKAEEPQAVRETVLSWLQAYGDILDAQFLLARWLDKAGDPEAIKETVLNWLQTHGETPEAGFVLAPWLDKAREPQAVKETVLKWLQAHGETPEAQFVLARWLDKAGEPQAVRETVLKWLRAHGETPEARFVLAPWLDKAGEPQAVKETVLKWLQAHGEGRRRDLSCPHGSTQQGSPMQLRRQSSTGSKHMEQRRRRDSS